MFDLAHEHDIARLTLSRPEARNAIPAAGWAALEEALGAAEAARIGLVEILAETAAHEDAETLARAIAAGSAASHRTLKRGIALAARGRSSDAAQDRDFDDLLGSDEFAGRLAAARQR